MLSNDFVAPEGWEWRGGNYLALIVPLDGWTLGKENDDYQEAMLNFFNFLEENDLKAAGYERCNTMCFVEGLDPRYAYVVQHFYMYVLQRPEEWPYSPSEEVKNIEFTCRCGNIEHDKSSLICHECLTLFYCTSCQRTRVDGADFDITASSSHTRCSHCGIPCDCGRFHSGYLEQCANCTPAYCCSNCGQWSNVEPTTIPEMDIDAVASYNLARMPALFCEGCHNQYCHNCQRFVDEYIENESHFCQRCEFLGAHGDNEIHDDNSDMTATKLALPGIPGREMIRLCGVEIEGGLGKEKQAMHTSGSILTGPNSLARSLYDAGLSDNHNMSSYHHGSGFARVEQDSSVDWECVIGPINMGDINNVRLFNNVIKLIKKHIKDGLLKLDLRCGTHIHVGAEKVSLGQAYNLHLLYTYMEDVMYRLGAAHWPVHRILIQGENAHGAQRSPKQDGKVKFARTFHGNRYFGLSFSNYFQRMLDTCSCGAAKYGAFEECTCNLGKCTFEFRLFNATANTIKLHAYLAICQALVAKAVSMPEIKDSEAFEAFPFVMSRYRDMDGDSQTEICDKWEERLRYIATDLPLTNSEKKSILYCIENSELAKVSDDTKALFKGEKENSMTIGTNPVNKAGI